MPRSHLAREDAAEAVIRLANVSKRYGETVAVDALSLDIAPGELVAMLGPSGCGKTTTLRMIAGFVEPDAGTIEVAGSSMHRVPPERRPVNTVFQSYALFPHLSVADNVAYGLRRAKVPVIEIASRVETALRQVHMETFADRMPASLSGGQQQRVALARALVNDPAILLLDEPFGALDLQLRMRMRDELRRVQRETRFAFLLVTHDQHEALSVADRIAVLDHGRLEQIGRPDEVYDRPATLFAARFLGACNLISGTVVSPGVAVLSDGSRVAVPDGHTGAGTFGIRPEKLFFGGRDGATITGWLREVSFEGALVRASVDLADGSNVSIVERNDGGAASLTARIGDEVALGWPEDHAFWIAERASDVLTEGVG